MIEDYVLYAYDIYGGNFQRPRHMLMDVELTFVNYIVDNMGSRLNRINGQNFQYSTDVIITHNPILGDLSIARIYDDEYTSTTYFSYN
jgi:hypothetical protein